MERPDPGMLAIVLPHRELYQEAGGGAVTFCVRDVSSYSRYLPRITVFGDPVDYPFARPAFRPVSLSPPCFRRRTLRYLLAIRKRMQRLRPALIEVHNRPLIALDLLRRQPAQPVMLYLHNDPLNMRGFNEAAVRRELLDRGGHVVGVSDYICQRMLQGIEGHPGGARVHTILNGVDTSLPVFNHLPEKRREILFVGRLIPEKGAVVYARAVAAVLAEHPDWRAVMIGSLKFDEPDRVKPYDAEVIEAMRSLGDQAEFTGYLERDEVLARMARAAIVVMPSVWEEPCGLVAIEAMASGCALVASRRGGLPDVVGDAGVLVGDVEAAPFAAAIAQLIGDDQRRLHLQEMAVQRAHTELDIRITASRLDLLRDALLSRAPLASSAAY